MTRQYTRRRTKTQPISVQVARPRPPGIDLVSFTCFRLVRALDDTLTPLELSFSTARMFAFATR